MQVSILKPKVGLDTTIGAEARQNLWLVIKETLNNVAKHSGANQATLRFEVNKNSVMIEIQDNGRGFNPDKLRKGRGMRNMPKRMKNIGGSFEIITQPQGTLVQLSAPIYAMTSAKQTLLQFINNILPKRRM